MGKKIRLLPSGKEIDAPEGESVLGALEKAGYALPNNCRAGACGECKSRLVSGEIDQGFVLDMALPRQEREKGYALMCMARPLSDIVEIEYGTQKALPELFPPGEKMPYTVVEKRSVTSSIVKLSLLALGEPMRFWPGQYVTLGNGSDAPARPYSIANTPNREGALVLLVGSVPGGKTSGWIHSRLAEGDPIELAGPYGTFVGDPATENSVLCLAAGSGLAPIRSLAGAALLRGGFKCPAHVLFSAATRADLFETGYFAFLQAKFDNFQFSYTLTRQENPDGLSGRIVDLLPHIYGDLSRYSVYIAGGTEFVADCARSAQKLGAASIHREAFSEAPR